MNRWRPRNAASSEKSKKKNENHDSRTMFTHCVACNYECRADFDVCPRCGRKAMSVYVLKQT